jgi:hypothetical protein
MEKENRSKGCNKSDRVPPRAAPWPPPWLSESASKHPDTIAEVYAQADSLPSNADPIDLAARTAETPFVDYHAELARWPIPWRESWGRLANKLQDQGIPWPEHERRAFDQIKAEMTAS